MDMDRKTRRALERQMAKNAGNAGWGKHVTGGQAFHATQASIKYDKEFILIEYSRPTTVMRLNPAQARSLAALINQAADIVEPPKAADEQPA